MQRADPRRRRLLIWLNARPEVRCFTSLSWLSSAVRNLPRWPSFGRPWSPNPRASSRRPPPGNSSAWRWGQRKPALAEPRWTTRNRRGAGVGLGAACATFRRLDEGVPTLLCAPFALHGSTITDFAAASQSGGCAAGRRDQAALRDGLALGEFGHALLLHRQLSRRAQRIGGRARRHGRSDRPLPGRLDGIGLCRAFSRQGPKLALAGTPIDIAAGASRLSELAATRLWLSFKDLVELGGGRVLGQHAAAVLGTACARRGDNSQLVASIGDDRARKHFGGWNSASATGMLGPWICPAAITCRWSSNCSRTIVLPPDILSHSAGGSISPRCAARCFCSLRGMTILSA